MENFAYLIPFLDGYHFKLGISSNNFKRIKKHNKTYGGIDYDNVYIISGSYKNIKHIEDIWKDNIPDDVSQLFDGKDGYTEVRGMEYFNECLNDVELFKYRMDLSLTKLSYDMIKNTSDGKGSDSKILNRIEKGFLKTKEYNANNNYIENELNGDYLSLTQICEEYNISESSSRRLWKNIRDENIKTYKGEIISKNIPLPTGKYKIHILKKYTDDKYNKTEPTEPIDKILPLYVKQSEELNDVRNELKEINKIILDSIISDDINILKERLKKLSCY